MGFQVQKCCGVSNLRTGIFWLAVLLISASVISVSVQTYLLLTHESAQSAHAVSTSVINTSSCHIEDKSQEATLGTYIFTEALSTLLCVLLIIHIMKRNLPGFLVVWIAAETVFLIVDTITSIALSIFDVNFTVCYIVLLIVKFVTRIYAMLVVYSHYCNLRKC